MRFGGPIFEQCGDPDAWCAALKRHDYSAGYCPVDPKADDATVRAYETAAAKANLVIAEVGAWCNPLSPEAEASRAALQRCQEHLALADRIGARCCVNIAGSRGPKWDGPDPANLTEDTFALIVEQVRAIIDAVKPTRSFYTLETMPWAYPDSADSYLRLIQAIDRKAFAVHLDPTNLVCSPQRYYTNGAMIRECFEKLGPHIRSCHAKDVLLDTRLLTHIDEVRAGLGNLDYSAYLAGLAKLEPDVPLMMEHLQTAEEYAHAENHIRGVAKKLGLTFL